MPAFFEDDLTLEERMELDHRDRDPPPRPIIWWAARIAGAILAVVLPLAVLAVITFSDRLLPLHTGAQ